MTLDGVPIPGAIDEDGVTQASVDARDAIWQHPDLLPDTEDLDDPAAFIDRVIGGDTSGIDEAIAEFERATTPAPATPTAALALWIAEPAVPRCRGTVPSMAQPTPSL